MATRRNLARAVAIADVYTLTITGTYLITETITLTINGKDLLLTMGTDRTVTQLATAIKEMVNGDDQTGAGDHTFSATGNNVGEYSRITATSSAGVVTLTHDDAGRPFTLTVAETGAGSVALAHPTVATGPDHFDNADNWSGDTVPVDADDIVFDEGSGSCLFGITQSFCPASLTMLQGWTGTAGLPRTNTDDPAHPFDEYLGQYLEFDDAAGQTTITIDIGQGVGQGSGRIKIDTNNCSGQTFNIHDSGSRAESAVPAILLRFTTSDTVVNVQRGDVGIAFHEGDTGHIGNLNVGFLEDQDRDSTVVCGNDADIGNATIDITGGVVSIDSATATGTITIDGGTLDVLSGAHASIIADGGTVNYQSTGTCTTAIFGPDAVLDFRKNQRARIFTNMTLHTGAALYDPFGTVTWTNGIDLVRCSPSDLIAFDVEPNKTWTPTAI